MQTVAVYAAGQGNYWPLVTAAACVVAGAWFGLDVRGTTSWLSRKLMERRPSTAKDIFRLAQLRLVLGGGPLIWAAMLIVLV